MNVTTGTRAKTFTLTQWFLPPAFKDEEPGEYVGRVAKSVRQSYGLTQKQVSEQSNKSSHPITQASISRIERGKWQSIKNVSAYLRGYGLVMGFDLEVERLSHEHNTLRELAQNPTNTTNEEKIV